MVAADPPRNTGLQQVFVERERRQKRETTEIRGKTQNKGTSKHFYLYNVSMHYLFCCKMHFHISLTQI